MQRNMFEIKDKVILITGAATSIGAAVVKSLLEEGAKHVAILDIAKSEGEELERVLNGKFGAYKVKFFFCDVTKDDQVEVAFKTTVNKFGVIDTVINNAGIMNDAENVYRKAIEVNFLALVTISLKAYEMMRVDRGGRGGTIVNIASIVALHQIIPLPIYSATKSAVLQFSLSLGIDVNFQHSGVRVITICFGATDTALLDLKRVGFIDEESKENFMDVMKVLPVQKKENAVAGVIESLKHGKNGSVWLATDDKSPEDYTAAIKAGYDQLYIYSKRK